MITTICSLVGVTQKAEVKNSKKISSMNIRRPTKRMVKRILIQSRASRKPRRMPSRAHLRILSQG